MSAAEIDLARRRLRERIEELLAPVELATYDAYHERVRAALDRSDPSPIEVMPAERLVLDKIAADTAAAALDKQLLALLRAIRLPQ